MSIVQVQEFGQSSGGKPKVKASGKWFFLAKNIAQPPQGASIEIKEGSFRAGDATFATIEDWRPAGGGNTQQPPAAPPAGYVDEASMRFISNCVGSAISAGTIKEPGQVLSWFQAAKAALEGKQAPDPFGDDSKIPFNR